jgi:hypothetical protein
MTFSTARDVMHTASLSSCSGDTHHGIHPPTPYTNSCDDDDDVDLNGLLHIPSSTSSGTTTSSSSNARTTPPRRNYELTLDRPSLQQWWNHQHHFDNRPSSSSSVWYRIITKLIHVLQQQQQQHLPYNMKMGIEPSTEDSTGMQRQREKRMDFESDGGSRRSPSGTDITSVFLSMDIFSNIGMVESSTSPFQNSKEGEHHINTLSVSSSSNTNTNSDMYDSNDIQQQELVRQELIQRLFQTLQQSLPHLHTVHVYNGPMEMHPNRPTTSPNHHRRHHFRTFRTDQPYTEDDRDDIHTDDGMQEEEDDHDNSVVSAAPNVVWIHGTTLAQIISPTLQSLIVTRCLYLENPIDVDRLAQTMRYHAHLRTVHFLSTYVVVTTDTLPLQLSQHPSNESPFHHVAVFDSMILALSTMSQLESINITVAKEDVTNLLLPQSTVMCWTHPPDHRHRVNHHDSSSWQQHRAWEGDGSGLPTVSTSIVERNRCSSLFSPFCLRQLIGQCPTLIDVTLWECQLTDAHLEAIGMALLHDDRHGTIQQQMKLQFISLRCNPMISNTAWCTFYTHTLPFCYTIQSIYNDHVGGLADCHPNLPMYGSSNSSGNATSDSRRTEIGLGGHYDTDTTPCVSSTTTTTTSVVTENASAAANAELLLGLNALGRGYVIRKTYANYDVSDSKNCNGGREPVVHCDGQQPLLDLLDDVTDTPSAIYALIRNHPMMVFPWNLKS